MLAHIRRALLVILVCMLPVQSLAAMLVPFTCSPQETHHALVAGHEAHDHAGHAHDEGAAGGPTHDHSSDGHGHLCCHQFSSAAPSVHAPPAPNDFRVYASAVSLLTPLHVPELPQRPPRV